MALALFYVGSINVVCVLLGMAAGWGLDQAAGTTPLLIIVGLAFGILGGVAVTVRVVRDYLRQ
jgi:F0F1-type ATP synthase assembly protein I